MSTQDTTLPPLFSDEQIVQLIYAQDPQFDEWHEGLSADDVIAIVRAAIAAQAQQPLPKDASGWNGSFEQAWRMGHCTRSKELTDDVRAQIEREVRAQQAQGVPDLRPVTQDEYIAQINPAALCNLMCTQNITDNCEGSLCMQTNRCSYKPCIAPAPQAEPQTPAPAHAEALRLADTIDPFVRKAAPDHLTSKVAADALRRLAGVEHELREEVEMLRGALGERESEIRRLNASPQAEPQPIPHTLGGFRGWMTGLNGRKPTDREIWDAAIRSYRDLAEPQQTADWRIPTTELQRMSDAVTLLCSGNRPNDEMVSSWLDCSSDDLQNFASTYGPAWAQGIGLLDAARIMVDQPTEGVDHEFSQQGQGIPDGYALVKVRDKEHRRQLIGDAIFSEPQQAEPLSWEEFAAASRKEFAEEGLDDDLENAPEHERAEVMRLVHMVGRTLATKWGIKLEEVGTKGGDK